MNTLLWILLAILTLSIGTFAQGATDPGVLGFQAWKSSRIEEARAGLDRIQQELQIEKVSIGDRTPIEKGTRGVAKDLKASNREEPSRQFKPARSDHRLEQARLNVEIAKELSVQDYFMLYLKQFRGREAYLEAAKKLTHEETAELLMAYQKQLGGYPGTEAEPALDKEEKAIQP